LQPDEGLERLERRRVRALRFTMRKDQRVGDRTPVLPAWTPSTALGCATRGLPQMLETIGARARLV
jgi:hypothetical protein